MSVPDKIFLELPTMEVVKGDSSLFDCQVVMLYNARTILNNSCFQSLDDTNAVAYSDVQLCTLSVHHLAYLFL